MISMASLVLFSLSVIGLTNIVVDPASIMIPFREYVEKKCPRWINKVFSCYQCFGTWAGFLCGYLVVDESPSVVFLCGMAGSFLSTISATYMNYLEARSIVGVEQE
jgi:hypothetical protein